MTNKLVFLILLLLSAVQTNWAQAVTKAKRKYDYLLYLPKNYQTRTEKYPLVIYLHGGSQKGKDLNKLKTYGLPSLVAKGQDFPFVIASPQCPDHKYWSTDNWFEALYAELTARYRIDTNRVYVTGISILAWAVLEPGR